MAANTVSELALIRRQAATVRMLLEELEQLTGEAAGQVSKQLAEELVVLARGLVDASLAISGVCAASSSEGEPARAATPARHP